MSNIIDKIQVSGVTYTLSAETSGGGTTYYAGRGIDITNDTISFSLPISAGTGTDSVKIGFSGNTASGENAFAEGGNTRSYGSCSHAEGMQTVASGSCSHAEGSETWAYGVQSHSEGSGTKAYGDYSHAEGHYTETKNRAEHASGQFNVSSSASTTFGDSGNTLFSVGNGSSSYSKHNAFEIRQNGDIYITSGGTDIKLQDNLGSTVEVSSAITSGDTNAVAGGAVYDKFDEVEQVTARALVDLNDKFGGLKLVKLTQSAYDALSPNYDNNTLYVIVN